MTKTQNAVAAARDALERAQAAIRDEISAYPTPISGCDAQFNHLLSQRTRIDRALASLDSEAFVPTPRSPSPSFALESR